MSTRAATRRVARRLSLGVTAVLVFLLGLGGLRAPADAAGGMLVVITGIHVGSPVMATQDSCNGYMEHRDPVVPVTVNAAFFGDQDPVGPYATAEWDGGFGSSDHHFGTAVASNRFQRFHILVRASALNGWRGAGTYWFQGLVQDVGLAGGFAVKSKDAYLAPPTPTTASVKCTITPVLGPKFVLNQVVGGALKELQKKICAACVTIKSTYGKFKAYSDALDGVLYDSMVDDPPDPEFQTLAQPVQAPVVAPPAGLTAAQGAAFAQLADRLATDLGTLRAIYATVNRVWGADNAADTHWHRRQLAHLATLTEVAAAGFEAQPPLWTAMVDSFDDELPDFTVGPTEVNASMADLDRGLPADERAVLTELGVSPADQQEIANLFSTYVEPLDVEPRSSRQALSETNAPDVARALRTWGDWAISAAEDDAPVVASVSPTELPSSGGTMVTLEGSNLNQVTGVNFGPSDVGRGQAELSGCTKTLCQVYAPPGTGSVDVVAVAPGGTSRPSAATRVTYSTPTVPVVADVYPDQGPLAGGTTVSVFGSGLAGGRVDFGTLTASEWQCRPTRCTAKVPRSGLPGPVDVTVLNGPHRSAASAATQYTYLATTPPAPPAPEVTGVSPASGTHLGGHQVTLTGDHFTDASSVVFQQATSQAEVRDFAVVDDEHITLTTPSMSAGVKDVVVRGPGGVSVPSAGSRYTGTQAVPTVTSITPTSGSALGGTRVTITGTDLTNAFISVGEGFGRGSVCAPTTCTFTTDPLDPGDPLGPVHVQASTPDGQSALTPADVFTFTAAPAPVVTALEPDTGSTAGGGTLVVTGTNLNGGQVTVGGTTASASGLGNRCSATTCVVQVPQHTAGDVPVVVTTHAGASAATAAATYSYVAPARPVVTIVSPREQWARGVDEVTVTGRHLTGGKVYFGDQQATDVECSSTQCTVLYPPSSDTAKTADVTVRTPGGTSATGPHTTFTWITPTVTAVSPASGWNDGTAQVTVAGTHLAGGRISFGGTLAPEECTAPTTCTVTAPKRSTTGAVDVVATAEDESTRSEVTAASRFTYTTRPLPTVTSVSPDHGNRRGREQVTITGTDLQKATITVGGTAASAVECQPTSCTFTTPFRDALGPVPVVATTSAGASTPGPGSTFTYQAPGVPTVTSVSPTSGSTAGGTKVTLIGEDLVGTVIRFGGAQQSAECNRTRCTVTTAAHAAGPQRVTAQSDAGTSTATDVTFEYVAPATPTITGVSPDRGPASGGTAVTLTGRDLYAGKVSLAGSAVTSTCDATECTFTVPAGTPGDVPVTVTTPGGTSPAAPFTREAVTLTELTIPGVTSGTGGGEVVRGIGGDIWFTLRNQHAVGRVKADGTIVTFPVTTGAHPGGISLGPDGRMWFAEPGTSHIGAMTGDGTLTEYPVPGGDDDLRFIEPGADGRLWFTASSGAVGAITTSGVVTKYFLPDPTVVPYHLLAGPDGRMWFTEWGGRWVGAVSMAGEVTEYPIGEPDVLSWDLKSGPDGRLWFTQAVGQAIAAVDPATGEVETYRLPPDVANPQGLTFGPDGRFWFVSPNVDRVSAWDPETEELTYYPMPAGTGAGHTPKYLAMDGRGDLYVTLVNHRTLLRVSGLTGTAAPRVTAVGPTHGAAGTVVTVTGATLATTRSVTVGGATAAFEVVDPAHLRVTVPAGSGDAPVRVTTAHGTSPAAPGAVFHYGTPPAPTPTVTSVDPPSGPVAGGTRITVTGTHLAGATLAVGGKAATGVACTATRCTATTPAGSLGTVHVVATTAAGKSAASPRDGFTYLAPAPAVPTVTGISPTSGPTSGGTAVTVTGTALSGGTVWFGTAVAAGSCGATSCTVSAPSGGVGPVHVRVATGGGTSARVPADRFTYLSAGATATTTTVTAAPGTVEVGEPVTFAVRVTPTAATGEVTLRDGGTTLGTVALTGGEAEFETSALTVGTHQVTAVYSGDATHAGSTAAPASVTVTGVPTKAATTTTLDASPGTVIEGQPLTLTAHVAPAAATGRVTFTDGAELLGRAQLDDGVAVLTTGLVGAGAHAITAAYEGDRGHEPSVSIVKTVQVRAFTMTETTLSGPATATLQAPVTLTASVTPRTAPGTVLFLDQTSGTSLGSAPVTSGTAKLTTTALGTGRHTLRAVFSSTDPSYSASASDELVVTVTGGTQPPPPPPPPPGAQVPGAPQGVAAKAAGHRKVVVTWGAPASAGSSAVTSYVVVAYRGTKVAKQVTVAAGKTKAKLAQLKAGARYRFVVYAVNAAGQSPASPPTKAVKPKR